MKNLKEQIYWQVHDTVKPIHQRAHSDDCMFGRVHAQVCEPIRDQVLIRMREFVRERIIYLRRVLNVRRRLNEKP